MQIVAAARVRDRHDHGLLGEIEPRRRIESIEVGPHDHPHVRGRKRRDVVEHVHRATDGPLARLDVGELLSSHVHRDERIEIDVSMDANGVRLFLADFGGLLGHDRLDCHQSYEHKRQDCDYTDFRFHAVTSFQVCCGQLSFAKDLARNGQPSMGLL